MAEGSGFPGSGNGFKALGSGIGVSALEFSDGGCGLRDYFLVHVGYKGRYK